MRRTLILAYQAMVNIRPWKMLVSKKTNLNYTARQLEAAISLLASFQHSLANLPRTENEYWRYRDTMRRTRKKMKLIDTAAIATFLDSLEDLPTELLSEDWIYLSVHRFNFLSQWQALLEFDFSEIVEIRKVKTIINEPIF